MLQESTGKTSKASVVKEVSLEEMYLILAIQTGKKKQLRDER